MRPAEIPLSRAKTTVPGRRPEIVSRARLLARLEELLDKQLVFITAPAGYGKTSLLVDLATTTEMPVCWFSLDALDQEPQRFLSYFIASIAQKYPHFGSQSLAALNEIASLDSSLENLIITIVNEIDETIHQHFAIIIDDYQFVDGIPEIRNFVGRFVQLVGENCHLILASRRLPTIPDLPMLVARQQVGGFDLHELAFRLEEIHQLFDEGYGVKLEDADAEVLARRTEGWVTGLILAQLGSIRGLPDLRRTARAVGVDLSDYFDQQVLEQQPPQVRSFLLQTSLLEEFDADLCDSVLGVGDWRKIMADVRRSNLFVLSTGLQGEWLRYHALFRDFLQERIQQESPDTKQAILLRLAEVSEERGDLEKAHYALLRVGNQDVLAAQVERSGEALIENGRLLTLSAWLDELPELIVQQSPTLLLYSAYVTIIKGQVQYGLALINQVEAVHRAHNDGLNLAVALVRRSWAQRLLGAYEPALADAEEALSLMRGKTSQEQILAEANRMKGLALFRLGQVKASEESLKRALDIFVRLEREKNIPLAQMELGMIRRALGDTVSSQIYYEKALAAWQEQGNLTSQATLLNSLGVLRHSCAEYEKAIQAFEKGLDCARRTGYTRSQALILASLGDLYVDIGDLDAASLVLQQAHDIALQAADHFLTNYSRVALAAVCRLKGDLEQGWILLQAAGTSLPGSGSYSEKGLHALESGRLHLASRQSRPAITDLQSALKCFKDGNLQVETTWARLWLAAAHVEAGELESASAVLEAALPSMEEGDHSPSFLPVALQVLPWLDILAGQKKTGRRVRLYLEKVVAFQKLLPSLRKRLRSFSTVVPSSAPDLVIRAFGKAQVRVKGRLVTNAQWQTRSVKELFFLFIHTRGALTKDQVGEILWPESDPEKMKLRFKNELFRLRRAVGQNVILFDGNAYRFNRDLGFEYDVDAFEDNLRRARAARDPEEKLRLCQEAVAEVRGLYLEDFGSIWVMADRERYRQEYLDILLTLAGLLLERKETEEALKVCQYALAVNKTFEEAYRLMMRIHAARGDRMGVTRQYQACHAALEGELGVPPSVETEALYHQLTA